MDKFQRERIRKLSKKELELELVQIGKLGNPLSLDEEFVLQELEKRKAVEQEKLKAQKEVIMGIPLSKIKGNLFLMECRSQVKAGKILSKSLLEIFKRETTK
jgi:hypothetical protein